MLRFKGGIAAECQRERTDRSHVVAKLAAIRRDYPASLQSYGWSKNPQRRLRDALAVRKALRAAIKG